jgi:hypothetical protein
LVGGLLTFSGAWYVDHRINRREAQARLREIYIQLNEAAAKMQIVADAAVARIGGGTPIEHLEKMFSVRVEALREMDHALLEMEFEVSPSSVAEKLVALRTKSNMFHANVIYSPEDLSDEAVAIWNDMVVLLNDLRNTSVAHQQNPKVYPVRRRILKLVSKLPLGSATRARIDKALAVRLKKRETPLPIKQKTDVGPPPDQT